jgi:hypothetical protein
VGDRVEDVAIDLGLNYAGMAGHVTNGARPRASVRALRREGSAVRGR